MGVGGGLIMVKEIIYIMNVKKNVVVGKQMLKIKLVKELKKVMKEKKKKQIDIVMELMMMVGGVIGEKYGEREGRKLRGEKLRMIMEIMVMEVGMRIELGILVRKEKML